MSRTQTKAFQASILYVLYNHEEYLNCWILNRITRELYDLGTRIHYTVFNGIENQLIKTQEFLSNLG